MENDSIWSSLEMHCVASGFSYKDDYLDLKEKYSSTGRELTEKSYDLLKEIFNIEFEKSMENSN